MDCYWRDLYATGEGRFKSSRAGQQTNIDCWRGGLDVDISYEHMPLRRGCNCCAGIMTTGEIPMSTDYEAVDGHFFVREGDELKPDPLVDDLALIIDTDFGLVVILGCATGV